MESASWLFLRDGSTAKVTYKVLDHGSNLEDDDPEPLVSVSSSGYVSSGAKSGRALLLIISHEESGVNQSLMVQVKVGWFLLGSLVWICIDQMTSSWIFLQVKPISYLMINADTVIHTKGSKLYAIPTGTNLHFSISFHDDVGQPFDATSTNIKYRPNRCAFRDICRKASSSCRSLSPPGLICCSCNMERTITHLWRRLRMKVSLFSRWDLPWPLITQRRVFSSFIYASSRCGIGRIHRSLTTWESRWGKWLHPTKPQSPLAASSVFRHLWSPAQVKIHGSSLFKFLSLLSLVYDYLWFMQVRAGRGPATVHLWWWTKLVALRWPHKRDLPSLIMLSLLTWVPRLRWQALHSELSTLPQNGEKVHFASWCLAGHCSTCFKNHFEE